MNLAKQKEEPADLEVQVDKYWDNYEMDELVNEW